MKKNISLIIALMLVFQAVKAQVDPHFTQYYMHPLFLNPALTGVISDGDVRVSGIYRNQWGTVSNPFQTVGVAADMLTTNNWGLGVNLINQTAANGGYNNTSAYASVANNNIRFGENGTHYISIGLQLGVISKRFNAGKLQFGDQFNPSTGTYNPNASSSGTQYIQNLSQTVFDAGAGIAYFDATPDKKVNFYGGIAVSHLTAPKDNFSGISDATIPMRITAHAGAKIVTSPTLVFYPNIIYMTQGNAYEAVPGLHAEMKANDDFSFLVGANYRIADAVNAFTGFYYKNYTVGLSYDVNISQLSSYVKPVNSFELSFSYIFLRNTKTDTHYFKCPRF